MSERYIPEHRRTQFKAKNTFKPDELRRRREEQQVEIRKAKREENLAKRRGITARDGSQTSAPGASLGATPDSDDEDGGSIESQVCFRVESLLRLGISSCLSSSVALQLFNILCIRLAMLCYSSSSWKKSLLLHQPQLSVFQTLLVQEQRPNANASLSSMSSYHRW